MIAVIFTSTRTKAGPAEYDAMAVRMEELAAAQDGFISIRSVRDPTTGEGITVSYWRDEASVRAWKAVEEHREAQRRGRAEWYLDYDVVVAEVTRRYGPEA